MRISSLLIIVVLLVAAISVLSLWLQPSIQDFMEANNLWNGIRIFNHDFGVRQLDSLQDLPEKPGKYVLLTLPYQDYNTEDLTRLKQFVENGGTLLLMDDFGYSNSILQYLGVNVRFDHNIMLDPFFCYRNPNLPRITDFTSGASDSGMKLLVLNHATVLSGVESYQVLAWSSDLSFLDMDIDGTWNAEEPKGPFAVAAEIRYGKGYLELVSDPSVLINTMVNRSDNYRFMSYLINRNGKPDAVLLDRSHLSKTPLDVAKIKLNEILMILSNPYATIGIVAVVFALVIGYSYKRGVTVG